MIDEDEARYGLARKAEAVMHTAAHATVPSSHALSRPCVQAVAAAHNGGPARSQTVAETHVGRRLAAG